MKSKTDDDMKCSCDENGRLIIACNDCCPSENFNEYDMQSQINEKVKKLRELLKKYVPIAYRFYFKKGVTEIFKK